MNTIANMRRAKKWMDTLKAYKKEIDKQVGNTTIYRGAIDTGNTPFGYKNTNVCLSENDTVSVIRKKANGKTAVLNFASFKNPGGGFMTGSMAQEEALCHETSLYPVLKRFKSKYYNDNCHRLHDGLYENAALYTKDVLVFEEDTLVTKCDIITCAAPNVKAFKIKNAKCSCDDVIAETLKDRIQFMLDIALVNGVDTLILGAWGCGVFGCDPEQVARIMCECLITDYKGDFEQVIFAIPNASGENFKAFKKVLLEYEEIF